MLARWRCLCLVGAGAAVQETESAVVRALIQRAPFCCSSSGNRPQEAAAAAKALAAARQSSNDEGELQGMLAELRRSLASEQAARAAAYQEKALIAIELEAKQRRFADQLAAAQAAAGAAQAQLAEADGRYQAAVDELRAERQRMVALQASAEG